MARGVHSHSGNIPIRLGDKLSSRGMQRCLRVVRVTAAPITRERASCKKKQLGSFLPSMSMCLYFPRA
jgi:hypothetical protein